VISKENWTNIALTGRLGPTHSNRQVDSPLAIACVAPAGDASLKSRGNVDAALRSEASYLDAAPLLQRLGGARVVAATEGEKQRRGKRWYRSAS